MIGGAPKRIGSAAARRRSGRLRLGDRRNAGSGKTRVLTDRVIRLLLAGSTPNAILCLTFTKAAAAEMANRLHQRLGRWSVLAEAELGSELSALLGRSPAREEVALARQLFARTLDAVGRLRIQTIHAFCESVLKRFPLEADVPPHFAIADDATSAQLLDEARDRLLLGAQAETLLAEALKFVVSEVEERGFQTVLNELVAERRKLRRLLGEHGQDIEAVIGAIRARLGVADGETLDALRAAFVAALPESDLRRAAAALDGGGVDGPEARRRHPRLSRRRRPGRASRRPIWRAIFLTETGSPRQTLITKGAQKRDPAAQAILEAEAEAGHRVPRAVQVDRRRHRHRIAAAARQHAALPTTRRRSERVPCSTTTT